MFVKLVQPIHHRTIRAVDPTQVKHGSTAELCFLSNWYLLDLGRLHVEIKAALSSEVNDYQMLGGTFDTEGGVMARELDSDMNFD